MKEKFTVTQQDIWDATQKRKLYFRDSDNPRFTPSEDCPISKVVQRTHPELRVGIYGVVKIGGHNLVSPNSVLSFIGKFDREEEVEPFEFELEFP